MRVVIIGGSAFCTPRLIRYLAAHVPKRMTITLAGRTPSHVGPVLRASALLAAGSNVRVNARTIDSQCVLSDVMRGADVILIQMRVGGYAGRMHDETFPLRFGICGDEGLGPGGLSAAWRTWPVMRALFTCIDAVCPRAQVLVLSSPVGLLVRAAAATFPNVATAGVCELPFTTLVDAAHAAHLNWRQLEWDYVGINHVGWYYRICAGGIDLLQPERPLALKYVRLNDDPAGVLREQRLRPGARALELDRLRNRVLSVFWNGTAVEVEQALSWRNANWYDEAVGPMLNFLNGGSADRPFFLTVPQRGLHSAFDNEDVMEVAHADGNDGRLSPRSVSKNPPERLVAILKRFVQYERTAAEAIVNRDVDRLREAIVQHPWVSEGSAVDELTRLVQDGQNVMDTQTLREMWS